MENGRPKAAGCRIPLIPKLRDKGAALELSPDA